MSHKNQPQRSSSRIFGLTAIVGLGLMVAACSSGDTANDAAPLIDPGGASNPGGEQFAPVPEGLVEAGRAHVEVDVRTGTVKFSPLGDTNGTKNTLGFGEISGGNVAFGTTQCHYGNAPAGNARCNPSGGVIPGCGATEFCAQVHLTQNLGHALHLPFVEVTNFKNVTPAGAGVSVANSVSPLGLGVYVPTLNLTHGAWMYASLQSGVQSVDGLWRFQAAGVNNFSFDVRLLAVVPRSIYVKEPASVATNGSLPAPDACAGGTEVLSNVHGSTSPATDTFVDIALPFPITVYEDTYTDASISVNGFLEFDRISEERRNVNATSFPTGDQLEAALMPFWDRLRTNHSANSKVCYRTVGTAPNRQFVVRWQDVTTQNSSSSRRLTFSVVINEFTDEVRFIYESPVSPRNHRIRASRATIGIQGYNASGNKVATIAHASNSGTTSYLPRSRAPNLWPRVIFMNPNDNP